MSDPLSVAASVAGLITLAGKLGIALYDFQLSVKDAPDAAFQLRKEIICVERALVQVSQLLNGPPTVESGPDPPTIMVQDFLVILTDCLSTFSNLDRLINSLLLKKDRTIIARAQWALKEKDIGKSINKLHRLQGTLTLMINILHCQTATEANSRILQLSKEISLLQAGMEMRDIVSKRLDSYDWETGCLSSTTDVASRDSSSTYIPPVESRRSSYRYSLVLKATRVYSRIVRPESMISFSSRSDLKTTAGKSVFTGLSISEMSSLSVFALPVFPHELSVPVGLEERPHLTVPEIALPPPSPPSSFISAAEESRSTANDHHTDYCAPLTPESLPQESPRTSEQLVEVLSDKAAPNDCLVSIKTQRRSLSEQSLNETTTLLSDQETDSRASSTSMEQSIDTNDHACASVPVVPVVTMGDVLFRYSCLLTRMEDVPTLRGYLDLTRWRRCTRFYSCDWSTSHLGVVALILDMLQSGFDLGFARNFCPRTDELPPSDMYVISSAAVLDRLQGRSKLKRFLQMYRRVSTHRVMDTSQLFDAPSSVENLMKIYECISLFVMQCEDSTKDLWYATSSQASAYFFQPEDITAMFSKRQSLANDPTHSTFINALESLFHHPFGTDPAHQKIPDSYLHLFGEGSGIWLPNLIRCERDLSDKLRVQLEQDPASRNWLSISRDMETLIMYAWSSWKPYVECLERLWLRWCEDNGPDVFSNWANWALLVPAAGAPLRRLVVYGLVLQGCLIQAPLNQMKDLSHALLRYHESLSNIAPSLVTLAQKWQYRSAMSLCWATCTRHSEWLEGQLYNHELQLYACLPVRLNDDPALKKMCIFLFPHGLYLVQIGDRTEFEPTMQLNTSQSTSILLAPGALTRSSATLEETEAFSWTLSGYGHPLVFDVESPQPEEEWYTGKEDEWYTGEYITVSKPLDVSQPIGLDRITLFAMSSQVHDEWSNNISRVLKI